MFTTSKKIILTLVALVVFSGTAYAGFTGGVHYSFWRLADSHSGHLDPGAHHPGDYLYGFGYGHLGYGYGYGYGYGVANYLGYYLGDKAYDDADDVDDIDDFFDHNADCNGPCDNTDRITLKKTTRIVGPGGAVIIPDGCVITQKNGGSFDATGLTDAQLSDLLASSIGPHAVIRGQLAFGIPSVSLHFSCPIKIMILVNQPNGTQVQVFAQHAGEGYTLNSLSTDPTATCNDGEATPVNNITTVQGGIVTIYSCAASKFAAFNGSGSAAPAGGGGAGGAGGGGAGSGTTKTTSTKTPVCTAAAEKATTTFTDIKGHWGETYIKGIAGLGIVNGKSATKFAPNDTITRAELTKIVINAFKVAKSEVTEAPFTDVATTDWFATYVAAAKTHGVVEGVGNDKFAPNMSINRADAIKIFLLAAGYDVKDATTSPFADVPVSQWFAKYVSLAKNLGVISGYTDTSFGPARSMTRAEAGKVVCKLLDLQ